MFAARHHLNRRRNTRPQKRSQRAGKLAYANLEDRRLLAVNLELIGATLIDGNFNPIVSPNVGEKVAVLATWNTEDLPANASYRIGFSVDGVALNGGITNAGAGIANGNGYQWYNLGWYASPGPHTVVVTADVENTVAEANEGDNQITFGFTPSAPTIPDTLMWPVEGERFTDYGIGNYVDVDPTGGISDYTGSNATYNGHNAFDAGPPTFTQMDQGIPLYAAANGTVVAVNDGEFDRQTDGFNQNPLPEANYIVIDHGAGWETFYWHLRRDSLQVNVGDVVSKGDFIGYMGSSGISTGNHIHFGVNHYGLNVETMYDEAAYFDMPVGYAGDNVYVYQSGVTNYSPTAHGGEGASQVLDWSQTAGQTTYVWAYFSGLRQNDFVQYRWYQPNGSLYTTGSFNVPQDYANSWWWFSRTLPASPATGTWRVDFVVDGDVKGSQTFEVSADGLPEIRVEDLSSNLIVDDRFTPIDFGEVPLFGADPSQTFRVFNHGFDTLETSNLTVPQNYNIVEGLSATIAPGGFDDFTVSLESSAPGNHAGQIRFDTNDADESEYNISVEGFVEPFGLHQLILGISERSVDEGSTLKANLRRLGSPTNPLTVTLTSMDETEVAPIGTVTFPAGADYVMFELNTLDDLIIDGDQIVRITAAASGYTSAANELEVQDITEVPFPFNVDFGPEGQDVYQDYIPVDFSVEYGAETGYGWLSDIQNTSEFIGSRGNNLTRDGILLRKGTFVVDVPNGNYDVTVRMGIVKKADNVLISVNGVDDTFEPAPGPNVTKVYQTIVNNGQISIYLDGLPGLNNRIRLSGLEVGPDNSPQPIPNVPGDDPFSGFATRWNNISNVPTLPGGGSVQPQVKVFAPMNQLATATLTREETEAVELSLATLKNESEGESLPLDAVEAVEGELLLEAALAELGNLRAIQSR